MKKFITTFFSIILFQGFAQSDSTYIKGSIIYYGDYLVFFPGHKHRGNLNKTLKKVIKINGINLLETCIQDPKLFCSAFENFVIDSTEINGKWKQLYIANVEVGYIADNLSKHGFNVQFEFLYNNNSCAIKSKDVIYDPTIITFKRKSNGEIMFNELKITPPHVLRDCN